MHNGLTDVRGYLGLLNHFGKILSVIAGFALVGVNAAYACDEGDDDCVQVGSWNLSLGLGYGQRSNPVVDGDDIPIVLLPALSYYGKRVFFETDTLGYTFVDDEKHMINLIATVSYDQMFFRDWSLGNFSLNSGGAGGPVSEGFVVADGVTGPLTPGEGSDSEPMPPQTGGDSPMDGRRDSDDPRTIEPDHRKVAVLAGVEYLFFYEDISFNLQALKDVRGVHNGHEVRAALSYRLPRERHAVNFTFGGEWRDSSTLDYFYGVDLNEASDNADVFVVDAGISPFIKIDWRYQINKKWRLQATANQRWLSTSVSDSPLIDEDSITTLFLGVVYDF